MLEYNQMTESSSAFDADRNIEPSIEAGRKQDMQDLEENRVTLAAEVKRAYRRTGIIRRTLLGLTLGLGVAGGIAHAQDSELAPWLVVAALPLGTAGVISGHNTKKTTDGWVNEFALLEAYAANQGAIERSDVRGAVPVATEKRTLDPVVPGMLAGVMNGFGSYGLTAEMAAGHLPTTTPSANVSSGLVLMGLALYGATEYSMTAHRNYLMQRLGVSPDPSRPNA